MLRGLVVVILKVTLGGTACRINGSSDRSISLWPGTAQPFVNILHWPYEDVMGTIAQA